MNGEAVSYINRTAPFNPTRNKSVSSKRVIIPTKRNTCTSHVIMHEMIYCSDSTDQSVYRWFIAYSHAAFTCLEPNMNDFVTLDYSLIQTHLQ